MVVIGRPLHKLVVFGTKEYQKNSYEHMEYIVNFLKHDGWTWSESESLSGVSYAFRELVGTAHTV